MAQPHRGNVADMFRRSAGEDRTHDADRFGVQRDVTVSGYDVDLVVIVHQDSNSRRLTEYDVAAAGVECYSGEPVELVDELVATASRRVHRKATHGGIDGEIGLTEASSGNRGLRRRDVGV